MTGGGSSVVASVVDASPLDASPLEARKASLAALGLETFDVLIVGGGIVGSGALLDATSRGLRAALVEQDDVAAGTSSREPGVPHRAKPLTLTRGEIPCDPTGVLMAIA